MRHKSMLLLRITAFACFVCVSSSPYASMPVERVLAGCVIDDIFYSVNGRAYRIRTGDSLDLHPFDGKAVSLRGLLYPGDRFQADTSARPEVNGACPTAALRLIQKEKAVDLRVAAKVLAKAGDFDQALDLIARAMATLAPAECDTFTDRAYVFALKGDIPSAANDLTTIKAKKCAIDRHMNWLLLQDVGDVLLAKGDKSAAIEAFELALMACDGAQCLGRASIADALDAAKR